MTERTPELQAFREMCEHHDLTYSYSDDHRYWERGTQSLATIREAAKKLPADDVKRIWDSVVDTKLVEGARENFYWRTPTMSSAKQSGEA